MKKFLSNALFVFAILALIVGALAFRSMFTPVTIETASMEPRLLVGTTVFIQQTDNLSVGDIITFQQEDAAMPTTHALVGFADDGSLITKGDAVAKVDPLMTPLQHSDVLGKVMMIVPLTAPAYWSTPFGIMTIVVLGLLAVAIAIMVFRKDKKEEGLPSEDKQEEVPELIPA